MDTFKEEAELQSVHNIFLKMLKLDYQTKSDYKDILTTQNSLLLQKHAANREF